MSELPTSGDDNVDGDDGGDGAGQTRSGWVGLSSWSCMEAPWQTLPCSAMASNQLYVNDFAISTDCLTDIDSSLDSGLYRSLDSGIVSSLDSGHRSSLVWS